MVETTPFRIAIGQDALDDLDRRLARARRIRFGGGGWDDGTSPDYLDAFIASWRDAFDWRAMEEKLNATEQSLVRLPEGAVHVRHVRSGAADATPLLLLHGFPDSFLRYERALPFFAAAPEGRHFDLVIPSLPGFGFSAPLAGDDAVPPLRRAAEALSRVMTEGLGYQRFVVAGGDAGSVVAQAMAVARPESVLGLHLTDIGFHALTGDRKATRAEEAYLDAATAADGAAAAVQATRPAALAPALEDSPIGLASWILDRFHDWSDGGDLDASFGRDLLIANCVIWQATRTIGPALALFAAEARQPSLTLADQVERPVALALHPKDVGGVPPRSLAERTLDVRRWTEMPKGGHLGAWEAPEAFVADVAAFCATLKG